VSYLPLIIPAICTTAAAPPTGRKRDKLQTEREAKPSQTKEEVDVPLSVNNYFVWPHSWAL